MQRKDFIMNEKDTMKLNDETVLEIESGAALSHILHLAANEEAALTVCESITDENLKYVEFSKADQEPYGIYDNLTTITAPTRQANEDGTVTVIISLREKTSLELRVDSLEETTVMLAADALA